ncbi:MAG: glycosyltransferase family 1 protein [Bacteroidales bacterium]|nr:glycosyltransferase family 1 protein [Bacteroidales bacterium]
MEPIRVLHILHSMNRGGAENAIMNYYRHIDRNKVQFDFLLTEQSKCQFEEEIVALGGKVFRVPPLTSRRPWQYFRSVSSFFHNHPDYRIVHSHTSSKSIFPLCIAKRCGIPIRISHSHNTKSESGIRGLIRNSLKLFLGTVATNYCACGKEAAVWLYGEKLYDSGHVLIVPNVIETQAFVFSKAIRDEYRRRFHLSDKTIVLGSTARFSNQKNHPFLLSLFSEFHALVPDSALLLLGDGELRGYLEDMAKDLGISDTVFFTGIVPNVADYEQAMDFFLMPSFYEGLPLSLVEAQVSGLKCFVSDTITKEADKTGLVEYLPLANGPKYWAKSIMASIGYNRCSRQFDIMSAGYDATTSAHTLQEFYLSSMK